MIRRHTTPALFILSLTMLTAGCGATSLDPDPQSAQSAQSEQEQTQDPTTGQPVEPPETPEAPETPETPEIPTAPSPSAPTLLVPAYPEEFQQIYRFDDFACVIDDEQRARCFGPGAPSPELIEELGEVAQLALIDGEVCALNTSKFIECASNNVNSINSRFTYRAIYAHERTVCGLGDYSAPYNKLQCGALWQDQAQALAPRALAAEAFISQEIAALNIQRGVKEAAPRYCALDLNGAIRCSFNDVLSESKPGPYTTFNQSIAGVVCARRGDSPAALECWDPWRDEEVEAPDGEFVQLYDAPCGLTQQGQVTCWHHEIPCRQVTYTTNQTVILEQAPRAFHATTDERGQHHWCAITAEGDIKCSSFDVAKF